MWRGRDGHPPDYHHDTIIPTPSLIPPHIKNEFPLLSHILSHTLGPMDDIIAEIFGHIDAGSTYKAARLVCRHWELIARQFQHRIIHWTNTLVALLENRQACLNMDRVSMNPNITLKYIMGHPGIPWRWDYVSRNPNITYDMVEAYPGLPWDWARLSENPNITMDIIRAHPERRWNTNRMMHNPNLTMEFIMANPQLPWNWRCISAHPCMTWDWMMVIDSASSSRFSSNPNLTIDILLDNPTHRWHWPWVSKNPAISWQDILAHPELPWDYLAAVDNPNVTIDIIVQHIALDLRPAIIKYRPDIIFGKPINWDWTAITIKPGITMEIIQAWPTLPWDNHLNDTYRWARSKDPRLTFEMITATPARWNWVYISSNKFSKDPALAEPSVG